MLMEPEEEIYASHRCPWCGSDTLRMDGRGCCVMDPAEDPFLDPRSAAETLTRLGSTGPDGEHVPRRTGKE